MSHTRLPVAIIEDNVSGSGNRSGGSAGITIASPRNGTTTRSSESAPSRTDGARPRTTVAPYAAVVRIVCEPFAVAFGLVQGHIDVMPGSGVWQLPAMLVCPGRGVRDCLTRVEQFRDGVPGVRG
jgi:hypothetical protein